MNFIRANKDYYGTPRGNLVFINPKYIIKLEFMIESKDSYGNVFPDHFIATIDLGNRVEIVHITLKKGNELLKREDYGQWIIAYWPSRGN